MVEAGWNLNAVPVMANSRGIKPEQAGRQRDLCGGADSRHRTAGNNGGAAQLWVHVVAESRRRARVVVEVRLPVEPDQSYHIFKSGCILNRINTTAQHIATQMAERLCKWPRSTPVQPLLFSTYCVVIR